MLRSSRSLSRASTGLRSNQRRIEAVVLAQAHQVVGAERKPALADAFGRSLEIGKVVARHLLVRADQQVRELPAGGAGLRQQLGDRRLQQFLGKQERRLERHARRAAGALPLKRGRLAFPDCRRETSAARAGTATTAGRARPPTAPACRSRSCSGRRPTARCRESSWMQRADSSSRVRPLRLRRARSLVPRKWLLRVCWVMAGSWDV